MNSGLRECVAVLSQSRASDCQFGQGIRLGPRFRQMKWNIVVPAERRGETPTCGKASASFRGRAGRDGKEFRRQRFLSAAARSNRLEKQTGKLNFPREGKHPRDSPRFTGSRIPSLSFPPLSLSLSLLYITRDLLKAVSLFVARAPIGTVSWVHFARLRRNLARNLEISI